MPNEWQPIETVPDGVEVLGLKQNGRPFFGQKYDLRKDGLIDCSVGRWAVCTHWMHLPDQPEETRNAE